ncbi:MAG: efflux RND transporter periplasmic adaptor subunit [Candidatus Rokubacteria bacterium]|nr:efflux RND transporter periplasmic adaptor subunit [Candidatus Rokubacteria bacterium]
MRRRALVLLVIVVAAAGALGAYFYTQSRGSTPRYRLAKVERGPLTATVSATGTLNAVITVQVGSQISGQIKELQADFNSQVKKGQVIARIDAEIFEAKVRQAQAELEAARAAVLNQQAQVERARADVENARAAQAGARAQTAKAQVAMLDAKRDLDRKSDLLRRELIAQSEKDTAQATYDSAVAQVEATRAQEQALASAIRAVEAQRKVAEAQLEAARAQVRQREAALKQAQVDLEHTVIRAPVNGVVVSRNVDIGQTVAASLQAPTLFTIAQDLTQMQVDTNVDEADIGRIRLGQRATFTVDSFPGQAFSGDVVQIRKAPQVVQNVVTYDVVVSAQNADLKLLPGMTANVRLVVDQKLSVLKVPNAALRFRPQGVEPDATARGGQPERAGQAGGGQSLEAIRERLVKDLNLGEEQQRRLDPILQESRQKVLALRGENLSDAERRARAQRIREAAREKIKEILTPEQRARYDQLVADQVGARGGISGRVWTPGPDGKPKAVTLRLGISDGTFTEVLDGELREGQEVIAGSTERAAPQRGPGGTGPRLRL